EKSKSVFQANDFPHFKLHEKMVKYLQDTYERRLNEVVLNKKMEEWIKNKYWASVNQYTSSPWLNRSSFRKARAICNKKYYAEFHYEKTMDHLKTCEKQSEKDLSEQLILA